MDIRELRYILEIATQRNMTRAASRLYISQPALSKVLKKVEGELARPLFSRDGTIMTPTDAGELLIRWGEQILKDFDALQSELSALVERKRYHLCGVALPSLARPYAVTYVAAVL